MVWAFFCFLFDCAGQANPDQKLTGYAPHSDKQHQRMQQQRRGAHTRRSRPPPALEAGAVPGRGRPPRDSGHGALAARAGPPAAVWRGAVRRCTLTHGRTVRLWWHGGLQGQQSMVAREGKGHGSAHSIYENLPAYRYGKLAYDTHAKRLTCLRTP
jgi:hypothetical protein